MNNKLYKSIYMPTYTMVV